MGRVRHLVPPAPSHSGWATKEFACASMTVRQSGETGLSICRDQGPVSQSFPVESIVMNSPVVNS